MSRQTKNERFVAIYGVVIAVALALWCTVGGSPWSFLSLAAAMLVIKGFAEGLAQNPNNRR